MIKTGCSIRSLQYATIFKVKNHKYLLNQVNIWNELKDTLTIIQLLADQLMGYSINWCPIKDILPTQNT